MRYAALIGALVIGLLFVAACRGVESTPTATTTQDLPGPGAQVQQVPPPTATPSPKFPGSITPVPASETYRLDLGPGVVVAFVEGLSPDMPDKVAYVTHVPSGSQAVLDRDGQVIDRHDGRGDGPSHLDAVLQDRAAKDRIMEGLKSDEDVRPRETLAEWAHSVQFGGITYLAKGSWFGSMIANGERAMTADDLGPELYRVAFRGDGYVGSYRYQDGDATYLNPGTPVYAVKGYVPEFCLATLEEGTVTLFEADTNPLATTGEDLLGIRGKVTAVRILSTDYARTVLGTIDEESQVERFVELVLQSPVDQEHRDHEGLHYFLGFRLADGTSVVRSFWLESGELWRGIMPDPIVALSVWRALGEHDRPVATGGGPRISERLAARLGLAYPGFGMPEVVATEKPHSPVVRLMRRSEFQAMRMSNPTATDPDPPVWVVEAQGSWRQAGIVPKEKRQGFSIGLVAFDANTGSRYGMSHGNMSLLGIRSDSQPVTTIVTPGPMPGATSAPSPTPRPKPTFPPRPTRPTPIVLADLNVVEMESSLWPNDLSGELLVGVGQDREVLLANVRTGGVRQLTSDGHRKSSPVISGNLVAWTDQRRQIETHDNNRRNGRGLADDIFVLDLNTSELRRITEVPAKRHGLQFHDSRLVWHDNRNEFGQHYTHYDIYAYDLEEDEEIEVAIAPGAQRGAAIHRDVVVWTDNRNSLTKGTVRAGCSNCSDNRFDIYLYDFDTGDQRVLDESGSNNRAPAVHGQHVVWRGFDEEGNASIYLYDLDKGRKHKIATTHLGNVDRPLVSENYVIWTVGVDCDVFTSPPQPVQTGVFAYDLRTGEVRQLSNYVEPSITVDGDVVFISEGCMMPGRLYAVFLDEHNATWRGSAE